jgi:hypothetical protein
LALVGGFPKIMKFADSRYSYEIRNEASILICQMANQDENGKIGRSIKDKEIKTNGVQMFISSGGLTDLSKFLYYDWSSFSAPLGKKIIFRTIDLSLNVINLQVVRDFNPFIF